MTLFKSIALLRQTQTNTGTMKNVFRHKKCNVGVVLLHAETPPTPMIKIKHNDKSEKGFVRIKLRRDTTSQKLDLYELKMALFGNGDPEEFLLFVRNFNMTLEASA